jgi:outer membrane receptor protein involved in Fe transport
MWSLKYMTTRLTHILASATTLALLATPVAFSRDVTLSSSPDDAALSADTDAAGSPAVGQPDSDTLAEVVVSANKRLEGLKEVPISISALNTDTLAASHISSFDDLSRSVPGLDFNSLAGTEGTTNIVIRGVSSTSGSATTAVYLDDVSLTTKNFFYDGAASPQLVVYDLERLEVLRGPQGTLYGDSSEGGTVRFITRQPSLDQWSGTVSTDLSQTERGGTNYFGGLTFNAPLIDNVAAVRGGIGYTHDSGWINHYTNPGQSDPNTLGQVTPVYQLQKRGVNDNSLFVAHLKGLVQASDDLTISPAFFYQTSKYGDSAAFYPAGQLSSSNPVGPPVQGLWNQDKEVAEPGVDSLMLYSLNINYKMGFADLTSVTGYFVRRYTRKIDGTYYNSGAFAALIDVPCPAPGSGPTFPNGAPNCDSAQQPLVDSVIANLPSQVNLTNHYRQASQEFRLSSPADGPTGLKWVAGLYFENSWIHDYDYQTIPGISTAFNNIFGLPMEQSYVNTLYGPPQAGTSLLFPGNVDEFDNRYYNEWQYAAFGQVDYSFTDKLHASLGLRYAITNEKYDSVESGFYQIPNISPFHQSGKFDALTPKAIVSYDVNTDTNVYTSVAKGYRNGGPTGPIAYGGLNGGVCGPNLATYGLNYGPEKFDSDSLWTYELGTKNRLLGNKLSIDGSVYATSWKNIQQSLYLPTCGYYFTANVGDAKIYGAEVEINYRPVSQLTLRLTADAQHAYISDAFNPSEASVGSWLIDVPKFTYDASGEYKFLLAADMSLTTRADYSFTGNSFGSYQPLDYLNSPATVNPNYRNPGYGVLNASLAFDSGNFELTAYAKNLANDRKIIQQPEVNTVFEAYTVHPRVVGLNVVYKLN